MTNRDGVGGKPSCPGSGIVLPPFLQAAANQVILLTVRTDGHCGGREVGSDMNTVYGEPVYVQVRDDGRPTRFVWRGRLYTVRVSLEHWVINREEALEPGRPELEFWRVEAAPGPGTTVGVYELRREAATDGWTVRGC